MVYSKRNYVRHAGFGLFSPTLSLYVVARYCGEMLLIVGFKSNSGKHIRRGRRRVLAKQPNSDKQCSVKKSGQYEGAPLSCTII